jgi:hypothetical protein
LVEARKSVACYHSLSLLSDEELRKRGLTRETVAHFALLGRVSRRCQSAKQPTEQTPKTWTKANSLVILERRGCTQECAIL